MNARTKVVKVLAQRKKSFPRKIFFPISCLSEYFAFFGCVRPSTGPRRGKPPGRGSAVGQLQCLSDDRKRKL